MNRNRYGVGYKEHVGERKERKKYAIIVSYLKS